LPEIRKQRIEIMGIVGPGSPGLYEAGQLAVLKDDLEYVMSSLPWANFKNPRTQKVAEDYLKRSGGKTFDTNSGYSYDGITLIADVLELAKSTDPDAIVEALRKSNWSGGLMQYAGPVTFNELGDNPNAVTTMVQILGGRPVAVWPREAALQKFVFPRPKA
ncbi:MAG TPA: ABC transporter substrate-binding protein, partial [Methylomirabilota bacterium]